MALPDVRAVLRRVYAEEKRSALSPALARQLDRLAARGTQQLFTQKEAMSVWRISQPAASKSLAELLRHGYVIEVERSESGEPGRPATHYALTGATRLIYDAPSQARPAGRRSRER